MKSYVHQKALQKHSGDARDVLKRRVFLSFF